MLRSTMLRSTIDLTPIEGESTPETCIRFAPAVECHLDDATEPQLQRWLRKFRKASVVDGNRTRRRRILEVLNRIRERILLTPPQQERPAALAAPPAPPPPARPQQELPAALAAPPPPARPQEEPRAALAAPPAPPPPARPQEEIPHPRYLETPPLLTQQLVQRCTVLGAFPKTAALDTKWLDPALENCLKCLVSGAVDACRELVAGRTPSAADALSRVLGMLEHMIRLATGACTRAGPDAHPTLRPHTVKGNNTWAIKVRFAPSEHLLAACLARVNARAATSRLRGDERDLVVRAVQHMYHIYRMKASLASSVE